MPVINAQRFIVAGNKNAVCGFSDCQSFSRKNWMMNSDLVHYNQPALNIMGASGGRVASELLVNMKPTQFDSDNQMFGMSMRRDRQWNAYYGTLLNESGSGWELSTYSSNPSVYDDATCNVTGVSLSNGSLLLNLAAPSEGYQLTSARVTENAEKYGLRANLSKLDANTLKLSAYLSCSVIVTNEGAILSASGGSVPSFISDIISVDVSKEEVTDVAFKGVTDNFPIVAPYGALSSPGVYENTEPSPRIVGSSGITINFPAGKPKSFCLCVNNLLLDMEYLAGIGRLQFYAVGGVTIL